MTGMSKTPDSGERAPRVPQRQRGRVSVRLNALHHGGFISPHNALAPGLRIRSEQALSIRRTELAMGCVRPTLIVGSSSQTQNRTGKM